jgi:protein TonB
MKLAWLLGLVCAILLHAGVVLFGGLVFGRDDDPKSKLTQVDLLATEDPAEKPKPPEEKPPEEPIESTTEKAPDAAEILRNLEQPLVNSAPALEAVSLGALEQALNGGGGGDFSSALSLASGGRIDGKGKGGLPDEKMESAFSLSEIDQKPRAVYQAAPLYPNEMRGKKVEGVVTLLFVVDASGKVSNPRVEKSTHPAFEKPALDALKQWKFEPAVKGGQRVGCKMRLPMRFQAS